MLLPAGFDQNCPFFAAVSINALIHLLLQGTKIPDDIDDLYAKKGHFGI